MSNEDRNEQHGQQEHLQHGSWQPTPQGGEYDADATAFVHLPPEDLANIPLAAPGHGYVPPMIVPLTPAAGLDPSATGSWVVQTQSQQERGTGAEQQAPETVQWPDPNHQQGPYDYEYEYPQQAPQVPQAPQAPQLPHDPYAQGQQYQQGPAATGQWNFTESAEFGVHTGQAGQAGLADHVGHPGQHVDHTGQHVDHTSQHGDSTGHTGHAGHSGHTGQWTIPVADGDLPEESGEFAASALAAQWYGDRTPPATLPGGAPAPWATQEPAPEPVREEPAAELAAEPALLADMEPEHAPEAEFEQQQPSSVEASSVTYEDVLRAPEAAVPGPEAAVETEAAPLETATETVPEAVPEAAPDAVLDTASVPDTGDVAAAEPPAEAAPEDPEQAAAPEAAQAGATAPESPPQEPQPVDSQPVDSQSVDSQPVDSQPVDPAPLGVPDDRPAASYVLHVNGADRPVTDAWIGESLLYVLRERLGLAGAKDGCSQGECGACNVQVDGRLVASCLVPAATAAGSEVRTVEGLAVDGEPSDVQRALAKCGAVQCGFCIPGMAMTVHDLLEGNHAPSELETRQALCGNLCRCSGYRGVLDAVNEVIAGREAEAATGTDPASSDSTSPEPDEARIPHQAAPGAGSVQSHPQDGGMA
ncbi:2Fe-2S iron-sulfur cluster-binding protein [Streptomyces sp. NPDC001890]|uniref:2Fe-2S iron-sulfur cluster-binding protein n=1 Tax=Streptomyces sp. NPDC001890 TaxID=3364620 RepID=UPI0036839BC8